MLKRSKTFINCLLIIVATPFMVLAATNTQELQEQIKARMNAAPGNKCTSITLVQNSDGKYTGTAEFSNGARLAIDVMVNGSGIQYTFGALVAPVKSPPTKPENSNEMGTSNVAEPLSYEQQTTSHSPDSLWHIILALLGIGAVGGAFSAFKDWIAEKYSYNVLDEFNIALCGIGMPLVLTTGIEIGMGGFNTTWVIIGLVSAIMVIAVFCRTIKETSLAVGIVMFPAQMILSPLIIIFKILACVFVIGLFLQALEWFNRKTSR